MFGEICPTPVEDTIPMVEKDTVNKQELPELPQEMGLIEITPISGDIITVKDSLSEKDSLTDVLEVAAVMPEFPGGARELMKFISANIRYPSMSQGGVCQGRAIVQFIVDKEGNIVQPKVVRGVFWIKTRHLPELKNENQAVAQGCMGQRFHADGRKARGR